MQAPPLPPALDFPRLKILAAGSSGSGKSCLIKRFCEGRFVPKYIPTIGIDYGVKKVEVKPALVSQHKQKMSSGGNSATASSSSSLLLSTLTAVRVNFWDVAGGAESVHIRNEFYAPAQGVLLVYDARDRSSFQALDAWLSEIRTYTGAAEASAAGAGSGAGGGDTVAVVIGADGRRRVSSTATTTSNTPAGRAVGDLDGKGPVIYIIANKVDDAATAPGESVRQVVTEAEGRQWAERNGCAAFFEASASSDLNVTLFMESLFYDVMAKFM